MARVLIIEDSSFQRLLIRDAMEGWGLETLEAESGKEGLARIDDGKPDLVLLDLLMPELDGIQVLREMRQRQQQIPVVVLTADIQDSARRQCLDLGAADVLCKPLRKEDLDRAIQRHLNGNGRRG